MSQESTVFMKLSREMNMTPACSETRSLLARPPSEAARHVAASHQGSGCTAVKKKEGEGDKEKKDILQMDSHKNIVSLSIKNDCGMKLV